MSDTLKYAAGLHVLEKMGENSRALNRQNQKLNEQEEILNQQEVELHRVKGVIEFEAEKNERIQDEADYYRLLLSKPMHEIANQNADFKKAYLIQQELLASWIVSQRAFKEIAMKYGKMAGKTPEQIQEEGMEAKKIILNDQSEFDNNLKEGSMEERFKETLLKKIKT